MADIILCHVFDGSGDFSVAIQNINCQFCSTFLIYIILFSMVYNGGNVIFLFNQKMLMRIVIIFFTNLCCQGFINNKSLTNSSVINTLVNNKIVFPEIYISQYLFHNL
jgi:hypothetical protein